MGMKKRRMTVMQGQQYFISDETWDGLITGGPLFLDTALPMLADIVYAHKRIPMRGWQWREKPPLTLLDHIEANAFGDV